MTSRPVRFGISLPNRAVLLGMPVDLLLETAERADASESFDSVWVGDNFLSNPRLEAIVTLSAIAGRTQRVKLGTICLASFPQRHAIQLAIQWASLDVLSGGRTILAVCLGKSAKAGPQFARELAALGVESNERAPRMEEGIELLRRCWAGGPFSHTGRFYNIEDLDVHPKPIQGRVPIVIAVNPPPTSDPVIQERALRRVARMADGWQTDSTPPSVFAERWKRIREYAAEYGRQGEVTDSSLHLMVNINDDPGAAHREAVEFLDRYYGEGVVSSEKLESWLAFGPPSAIVDKIGEFLQAGCTTPVLRFTSSDQLGQLERCIRDVMPAFRGVAAPG